jgi:hypothetical protein
MADLPPLIVTIDRATGVLELADWSGVRVSDAPEEAVPVRASRGGWHG